MLRVVAMIAIVLASASPALAGPALEPGAYKVSADLLLPNIEDMNVVRTETLCLTGDGVHGIKVMSENNPLARCPISNVRESGDTMTFDIVCEGHNQAKATAVYTLMGTSFRGRIAMTMGGKNMTMTEAQEGHRLGACKPTS